MRNLGLIIHNVRSAHNVGSLLRTAEGLGVEKVYLTGYTPYPRMLGDSRLPHIAAKVESRIHKTALGAEKYLDWEFCEKFADAIERLKSEGFEICALEQSAGSVKLNEAKFGDKVAIIVGNEVDGLDKDALAAVSKVLEIPMLGKKESFNVAQAAAMALYAARFS